jgi:hypothetical protein
MDRRPLWRARASDPATSCGAARPGAGAHLKIPFRINPVAAAVAVVYLHEPRSGRHLRNLSLGQDAITAATVVVQLLKDVFLPCQVI